MSDNEPRASIESILLSNDLTAIPPEEIKEPEVTPEAEITDPPVTEPEPEKVDEVVEEARTEPEPEIESQKDPEGDEGEEYTQEQWDALPEEEQAKATAEYEASLKTVEEQEADRQATITEETTKLKDGRLALEKDKLEFDQQMVTQKKEADKNYQEKMELLVKEAEDAGIADKFKRAKAEARGKTAGPADPLFPAYVPKLLVTQAEVKSQRLTQPQIDALNEQRNASTKTNHDRMADHFNSQTEFINEIRAERAQTAAFAKRAKDWGDTIKGLSEELGFEIFGEDGKHTPEINQVYGELGKVGALEQNDSTPEYRANMVRLIRNSVNGSASPKPNGQLAVLKLTKAPPGQTLRDSSQKIPRRKRPPNTMGGRGTGSREVQTKRQNDKDIIMDNK